MLNACRDAGAEVQRPLATAVIGGLHTSTFLMLILVPVLYAWLERDAVESTPDPAPEAKPEAREATETALSVSASHS